ncbi:hydrogenase expression protein [Ktedonobacter sp. SOSP1-85]|uniref:efflux RND transporter permease subunit n=1 Tax=Ktedonobacter sp. SOSP1-85 TaxID=2778367 RepID=UPI0019157D9F|nr:efflux RND transporter permease subunit [Ktedonobacter sp. SOSP1-85]GHO80541.1 hydrogenase expression protein [Ktedonobacter sp. SOSP1-85]
MSSLSRLSLANRSIAALVTIAVILVGAFVIPSLKQELMPSLSFPAISIVTVYPGASPQSVEQEVTNPLEKSIQGVQGLQQITSYSSEGVSQIIVQYDYSVDLDKANQTLTQLVNKAQTSLPSSVAPQVNTFNIADQPIIRLAVSSSSNQQDLAVKLDQDVTPVLEGLNGVGQVQVTGVRAQIVQITLDLKKLQAKGLSTSQVQSILQANNTTISVGEVKDNGQTVAVRVNNAVTTLDDLKNLVVSGGSSTSQQASSSMPGGQKLPPGMTLPTTTTQSTPSQPVKLEDVATVEQVLSPSTTLTRTNGKDSLGISITKNSNANTVSVSQEVKNKLSELEQKLGSGATITVIADQAPSIQASVNDLVREGAIGAGFAILTILLFLLSIRSTLVTAISIPVSIIIALIGLWVGGFSLNILTLGGLTIAIGRVVDDSIVVLENIYRHLHSGEEKRTAVLNGVREVAGAITASTLTTVAVFLPIAFTTGLVGEFFQPFSVAVTIALLASLLIALTIIPVLAYWFLKTPKRAQHTDSHEKVGILEKVYVPMIRWVTHYRVVTLIIALALLVSAGWGATKLDTNLIGNSSSNSFTISQQLPATADLDTTNKAAQEVEAILKNIQGIKNYQVTIGSGGSGGGGRFFGSSGGSTNTATFAVTTNDGVDQTTVQQQVSDQIKTLSNAGTITVAGSQSSGSSSTLSINVQASDEGTLNQATQEVLDSVTQTPNLKDVTSSLVNAAPLIDIHVDGEKALKYGLTPSQVGQVLRTIYNGTTVTNVTLNGKTQEVDLKFGDPATTVEGMKDMLIPSTTGTVRLGDLATVTQVNGPTQITHVSGSRTATISATVTSQNVGAVSANVQSRLKALSLPAGASFSLGGVSSMQSQAFQSLGLALLIAILLVYVVMVATFRSLLQPLLLLVSIPLAGTGSVALLLITHTALGLPALIGMLMLIGIVVTNAIVLLDLVNQYRKKGLDARTAVIEGGRRRLRPILMTAVATILALIPMALGVSGSSAFLSGPLAIVVIGGLTSSTFLTLLVVPTLYTIVEDIRGRSGSLPSQEELPPVPEPQSQMV